MPFSRYHIEVALHCIVYEVARVDIREVLLPFEVLTLQHKEEVAP